MERGIFSPGKKVCGGDLTKGCSIIGLLETCASISDLVIRPPGPVPLILLKSKPCSIASFSATGLILIFSDSGWFTTGVSTDGCSTGVFFSICFSSDLAEGSLVTVFVGFDVSDKDSFISFTTTAIELPTSADSPSFIKILPINPVK